MVLKRCSSNGNDDEDRERNSPDNANQGWRLGVIVVDTKPVEHGHPGAHERGSIDGVHPLWHLINSNVFSVSRHGNVNASRGRWCWTGRWAGR